VRNLHANPLEQSHPEAFHGLVMGSSIVLLSVISILIFTLPAFSQKPRKPIQIAKTIFFNYVEYSESTDGMENKDAMKKALIELKTFATDADLPFLINIWMYYDPTDFPTRQLVEPIFFARPKASLKAVSKRIKYKRKGESSEDAPYVDLFDLQERIRSVAP
jgi:hypothetical protein